MPYRPYHCNQNRVEYSDKEHHVRSRAIPTRNEGCYNKTGISHYRPFGNVVRLVDFRFHHAKALKCPRDHDTDADFAFTPPVFKLPLGIFLLVLAVLVTSVLGAAGLLDVEALHHYRHIIRDRDQHHKHFLCRKFRLE